MKTKVWVVDDNPAVAESIVAMLETEGIHAMALLNGSSALHHLVQGTYPRAMILDISMPEGDGNSVIREIKTHPEWVFPIIILTGWEDRLKKELQGRVFKVLPKTVPPLELVAVLRRAMGERIQWTEDTIN